MPEVTININLPPGVCINVGDWDASAGTYPPGASVKKGHRYRISVAGPIGVEGEIVQVGTIIEAWKDNPGQVIENWSRIFAS